MSQHPQQQVGSTCVIDLEVGATNSAECFLPTADPVRVLLRVQRVGQGERRHDRFGRRSGPNVVHRLRGGTRWRGAAGERGELIQYYEPKIVSSDKSNTCHMTGELVELLAKPRIPECRRGGRFCLLRLLRFDGDAAGQADVHVRGGHQDLQGDDGQGQKRQDGAGERGCGSETANCNDRGCRGRGVRGGLYGRGVEGGLPGLRQEQQ